MSSAKCDRCQKPFDGVGRYCERCKPIRSAVVQAKPKQRDPFYGTARWRRFRDWYIKLNPLCAHCRAQGRTTIATVVDHIIEIKDGGAKLDSANVQSLCRKCHARKTAGEAKARRRMWQGKQ